MHVGKADGDAIIRKALAIGGDDAVRIDAEPEDAFFVANEIAAYAKSENYDIIFTGKETIDYNGSQVGGMIAGLLDTPSFHWHQNLNSTEIRPPSNAI